MLFMGGESQRVIFSVFSGYSSQAQFTGKPAYLEPNSQSMQKTRRSRVAIGENQAQNHVEKQTQTRTYLEPIRDSLQKP
jgi:hypothetical protein